MTAGVGAEFEMGVLLGFVCLCSSLNCGVIILFFNVSTFKTMNEIQLTPALAGLQAVLALSTAASDSKLIGAAI